MKISHGSILAVFFQATPVERQHGAQWYPAAAAACRTMATAHSLPIETVAGVLAALSPNNKWERNLTDADNICRLYALGGYSDAEQCRVGTYNANKRKALQILGGNSPETILGGLKVRAFYGCILGRSAVCVDGHAYAIWRGEQISTTKTPKISPKLYASIAADYQHAADTINQILAADYTAAQIQAITWTTWRRLVKGGR